MYYLVSGQEQDRASLLFENRLKQRRYVLLLTPFFRMGGMNKKKKDFSPWSSMLADRRPC